MTQKQKRKKVVYADAGMQATEGLQRASNLVLGTTAATIGIGSTLAVGGALSGALGGIKI